METIKIIALSGFVFTIVDADLFDWINRWKWSLSSHGYACRYERESRDGKQLKIYLHAAINGTPKGLETDHINGFPLDNRRSNLRTADKSQNMRNARKHQRGNVTSQHKGVWKSKAGRWIAQIGVNKTRKHLGTFDTEIEAALAYNRAALIHHGDFSKPNKLN